MPTIHINFAKSANVAAQLAGDPHCGCHRRPYDLVEKNSIDKLALGDFVFSRDVIEYVVREAERYEALLVKSSRLRFDLDKLVKLRLGPD